MCGIAGFTGQGTDTILSNMINSIRYRGPDVQNTYFGNGVGLAHARLSILDLRPEGNQPMFSNNKRSVIIFNGEIYNFLVLKKKLEKKTNFITNTDTEVLLALYEEYGTRMLEHMNGMFAFALYDFDKRSLFVARDRMGKKPLYYSVTANGFIFGSELKALLQHPAVVKELNVDAVNQFLTFDYVPAPDSIIKNVYKLEPAHYLIIKENKIEAKQQYWHTNFDIDSNILFNDAKDRLDVLLNEATALRLMSDVPLGVFLSGGLDSSTVAYYAQRNSVSKIKTFSIGFEDRSYNESNYARQVANHLGTHHHCEILTASKTLALIDEIYPLVDEPFADASLIPTYFLSQFTHKHVTVALGGDGADELMAGYPTFIADKWKKFLGTLPKKMIAAMMRIADFMLPVSDANISFDFKVKQFLRGFAGDYNHIHQLWLGSFLPSEKKDLFLPHVYQTLYDKGGLALVDSHFNSTKHGWIDFNKITYYYYQTYLPDDILTKVDRASMYNSLEVRAPFLDRSVVEFLNTLPKHFKQVGNEGKFILKKLMETKLPKEIVYRNKKGFGIPLSHWIRYDLKSIIRDVLLYEDAIFSHEKIQRLISEHESGKYNHRKLIWNLFIMKKYLIQNNLGL